MWTCSYCAVVNRAIWQAKLINHITKSDHKWCWFTLTAHSKMRGDKLSLQNLRQAWDKMVKRMKRKYGAFDYCRVYEPHKDGSFHCHAIASFHFADIAVMKQKNGKNVNYSKWVKKTAIDLHLGWYTHADNIPSDMHGGYISSYITKYIVKLSLSDKQEIGRIRHIQTSQGWTELKNESDLEWGLSYFITQKDVEYIWELGGQVIDIQTGEILTYDNFLNDVIYPNDKP